MQVAQGSIVAAVKPKNLSILLTCFQHHGYGRSTGLTIRSPQEGVGSSPTFGTQELRRFSAIRRLALITMAAHTGARRNELVRMRVTDVDFDGGVVGNDGC